MMKNDDDVSLTFSLCVAFFLFSIRWQRVSHFFSFLKFHLAKSKVNYTYNSTMRSRRRKKTLKMIPLTHDK